MIADKPDFICLKIAFHEKIFQACLSRKVNRKNPLPRNFRSGSNHVSQWDNDHFNDLFWTNYVASILEFLELISNCCKNRNLLHRDLVKTVKKWFMSCRVSWVILSDNVPVYLVDVNHAGKTGSYLSSFVLVFACVISNSMNGT